MGFKKDRGVNLLDEIIETAKEVFPEAEEKKTETPEEPEIIADNEVLTTKEILQQIKNPIKKKAKKKLIKKRQDTKPVINCGITGDTIEVRDFRAIIKKKGLQINVVLNGIIAEWNHTNYNL